MKDNIDTADRMMTTAGSLALDGARPPTRRVHRRAAARGRRGAARQDEPERVGQLPLHALVQRLERAGRAVPQPVCARPQPLRFELGHGRGHRRQPGGGWRRHETDGSIVCPSAACGLVGIKPTVGLVSRAGIIPISHTPGHGRPDDAHGARRRAARRSPAPTPRDARDRRGAARDADYTPFLDADGLKGARIGVARQLFGFSPSPIGRRRGYRGHEGARRGDRRSGGHPDTLGEYDDSEFEMLLYEFKADLNAYLQGWRVRGEVRCWTSSPSTSGARREMPFFGQELFLRPRRRGRSPSRRTATRSRRTCRSRARRDRCA